MAAASRETIETAHVRRSPRYGVFIALGVALGILASLILTFVFDGTQGAGVTGVRYSSTQVFGFLLLFCIPAGIALSATVAIILDRVVGRRTRDVRIVHERVHEEPSADPTAD